MDKEIIRFIELYYSRIEIVLISLIIITALSIFGLAIQILRMPKDDLEKLNEPNIDK